MPTKRLGEHLAIVAIGNEHDLRMELDACRQQALEHVDAMLRVLAYQLFAHLRIACLQRNAQRRYTLLDDALLVFGRNLVSVTKVPTRKAQPEIVVAQV